MPRQPKTNILTANINKYLTSSQFMTELKEVGLLEDYEEYRHLESQKNENGVNQTKVFFSIFVIE
jgi:hypothetical protein